MNFEFTTFIIEIINFLILVWLLKKLLYNPIISNLQKRKDYIDNKLEEAEKKKKEVEELKIKYDSLIKDYEQLKKDTMIKLQQEISLEKDILFTQLQEELEKKKEKFNSGLESERKEFLNSLNDTIIITATDFSEKILRRFADKNLQNILINYALDKVNKFSDLEIKNINIELEKLEFITVEFPQMPDNEEKDLISHKLSERLGRMFDLKINLNKELISGIKIYLGTKVIDSSLNLQLESFKGILKENAGNI